MRCNSFAPCTVSLAVSLLLLQQVGWPCFVSPVTLRLHKRTSLAATAEQEASPLVPSPWSLPQHPTNQHVSSILESTERVIQRILSGEVDSILRPFASQKHVDEVHANTYVNMGTADVVGFDYDYTLVRYTPELLSKLYELAKAQLTSKFRYPPELLKDQHYDPSFAIRGLAVDLDNAWICKLTAGYRISTAFFGRKRMDQHQIRKMYRSTKGTGISTLNERMRRLRPLNDLFSMVEACLLADVVQWFTDKAIPFDPRGVVTDVVKAVGKVHTSQSLHSIVVKDLDRFIEPDPPNLLRKLLEQLKDAGKELMLASNSEFWYVDAGMKHMLGENWRDLFDVVVVSAGKPAFYTQSRPFRQVSQETGAIEFKPITELSPNAVYCDGSIEELLRLKGWDASSIIYLGDSLFADLVEARRLWGWTTGAIIPELRHELEVQSSPGWCRLRHSVHVLRRCLRLCQDAMCEDREGSARRYSEEDHAVLDALEQLTAGFQECSESFVNPNFGSVFRAARSFHTKPSFFARSLQRHVDFYTSSIVNLYQHSADARWYPHEKHVGITSELRQTHLLMNDLGKKLPDDSEVFTDLPVSSVIG
eukprot:TRINITY_DN76086_c0_g1_i1.p1 TRINITY_DN76086_c0_g1~~TRINITY_DN76086_c0_g1_i1.p1  ORF type:complete len:591 (-),score=97.63 TRINITY_DN76086_c0_g1_i1:105-1877(-)